MNSEKLLFNSRTVRLFALNLYLHFTTEVTFNVVNIYIYNVVTKKRNLLKLRGFTAQKIMFSIKDFFSKCDQMRMRIILALPFLPKYLKVTSATKQ